MDKIKCLICDKEMKMITNSHLKSHNVSPEEYKIMYGEDSLLSTTARNNLLTRKTSKGHKQSLETKNKISLSKKKKFNSGETVTHNKIHADKEEAYKYKKLCMRVKNNIKFIPKKYLDVNKKFNIVKIEYVSQVENIMSRVDKKYETNYGTFDKKVSSIHDSILRKQNDIDKIKKFEELTGLTVVSSINGRHELVCTCGNKMWYTEQYINPSKIRNDFCQCKKDITPGRSKAEIEIFEYIKNIDSNITHSRRDIISKEIDIYLPDKKLAIEYCGLYWHSELRGKDRKYHINKMIECAEQGIRLVTIFEDEFINNKNIVLSRIDNLLGISKERIYARKCTVSEIGSLECNTFLNNNHLQGSGKSHIRLGLFHDNKLVSVMTFQNGDISKNLKEWELNRFCSLSGVNVIGGASKMLKYLLSKNNSIDKIISYSDNRWGTGDVYSKIGFKKISDGTPNYWYIKFPNKRLHRFSLRKNPNDDQNLTEWENRILQGYDRIWDCGSSKWEWTR